MQEGTYLYEPEPHRLTPVAAGDIRRLALGRGQQDAGRRPQYASSTWSTSSDSSAPGSRNPASTMRRSQKSYYFVDTGLVAQNVYLAAAALGLGAWFHNCDREAFEQALGLGPDLRPVFGQTIGYASEQPVHIR